MKPLVVAAIVLASWFASTSLPAAEPTNVLLIMADDRCESPNELAFVLR